MHIYIIGAFLAGRTALLLLKGGRNRLPGLPNPVTDQQDDLQSVMVTFAGHGRFAAAGGGQCCLHAAPSRHSSALCTTFEGCDEIPSDIRPPITTLGSRRQAVPRPIG